MPISPAEWSSTADTEYDVTVKDADGTEVFLFGDRVRFSDLFDDEDDPLASIDVEALPTDAANPEAVDTIDEDGSYSLELAADRTYELVVEADGFERFTTEVTVETDEVHTEPIVLTADEDPEDDDDSGLPAYADDEGVVGSDGVQDAFADWQAGEIDSSALQDVFAAWQSGNPVV